MEAMSNMFTNPLLMSQMELDGFIKIPFATGEIVNDLRNYYFSLAKLPAKGTHVTMFNPSVEYRQNVDKKIKEVFESAVSELLPGYRILYANFMVKEPGPEGDFPLHQDWTYVDENRFVSFGFWIPLQDVNHLNGTLQVAPGSHKLLTALRGPHVHEPFSGISNEIKDKYSIPLQLKAGEAVVWDHRLLHFSRSNQTHQMRLAVALIVVPQQAEVLHCFGKQEKGGEEIEVFNVDTGFFMQYEIGKRPVGVPLKETVFQSRINFNEQRFAETLNTKAEL